MGGLAFPRRRDEDNSLSPALSPEYGEEGGRVL